MLDPLLHLIGTWDGHETGAAGEGVATRTYALLFLEARHRAVLEPRGGNSDGEVHEELQIFSADGGGIVAREFHSDGMVISYALVESADERLVFAMTRIENGPPGVIARLTLTMDGSDRFVEVLELGSETGALQEFIRLDWERSDGAPDV